MILKPTVVFAARANQQSFAYPIAEVAYDGVTTGVAADVLPGMTIQFGSAPGGSEWGRQRIRKAATADTLYFGRSSGGGRPGEVALQDDAYITVYEDYRMWLKMQRIDPDGSIYKDSDIAYVDQTIAPPPVAVFQSAYAGTVDGAGAIFVEFDSLDSFAVAAGQTISSVLWDVSDGTIVTGTATSSVIEATFPAGARYVSLTVTDSNGNSHTTRRLVYAHEDGDDYTVEGEITRHEWDGQGQQMAIRLHQDLDPADYPDGAPVLIWDGEPSSSADRSNVLFSGWIDTEPVQAGARRTGYLRDTTLELVDAAGMLKQLGGRPEYVENTETPTKWTQMKGVTIDAFHHYLLHWHSTALEVTSYLDPALGSDFSMISLGSDAGTLWEQVDGLCRKLTPDRHFTCDTYGTLRTVVDPMLRDAADRTSVVQRNLDEGDYTDIRFTYRPLPRYTITREGAIKPDASYVEDIGEDYELTTFFCIAPGEAWGQGPAEWERNEGIARSQTDLNSSAGHRYARLNAPYTDFEIDLAADMHPAIEPAHMTWVNVTFSAQYAAQRGFSFVNARGLPKRVVIRYDTQSGTPVRSATLFWELEISGLPAVTEVVNKGTDLPDNEFWGPGYEEDNFVDVTVPAELLTDTGLYVGHNNVVLIGNSGRIYQTANFQDASPTWVSVTPSPVVGAVHSFVVDPFSPGYRGTGTEINGWFARPTGDVNAIYRVTDLFGTPAATLQLTVSFADSANATFRAIHASFGRYFETEIENPWLVCISYYADNASRPGTWAAYSKDAGVTWSSEVQITPYYGPISSLYFSQLSAYLSPKTPGLAYTTAYTSTGIAGEAAGYVSTDWGATWSALGNPVINSGTRQAGALHVPWPNNDDEELVYHGGVTISPVHAHRLYRVSGTSVTDISPTDGTRFYGTGNEHYTHNHMPFGIRTYDNNRQYVAVAGFGNDASVNISDAKLAAFVSSDHGDTWTRVTDIIAWAVGVKAPLQVAFAGDSPDVLYLWGKGGYIGYSDDFGVTIQDKAGNMEAVRAASDIFVGIAGGLT